MWSAAAGAQRVRFFCFARDGVEVPPAVHCVFILQLLLILTSSFFRVHSR